MPFKTKRAYDEPKSGDGHRILVDRLWPRGISKEDLLLDEWMKELAPSNDLRKWFDHDAEKFEEFREKYRYELENKPELIDKIMEIGNQKTVTLVYAAKNREHNNAVVLKQYLAENLKN